MNIKKYFLFFSLFLNSCSNLMPLADDVEKIADDNALTVKVNKEAMQKETDVRIQIDVKNKDIKE